MILLITKKFDRLTYPKLGLKSVKNGALSGGLTKLAPTWGFNCLNKQATFYV